MQEVIIFEDEEDKDERRIWHLEEVDKANDAEPPSEFVLPELLFVNTNETSTEQNHAQTSESMKNVSLLT